MTALDLFDVLSFLGLYSQPGRMRKDITDNSSSHRGKYPVEREARCMSSWLFSSVLSEAFVETELRSCAAFAIIFFRIRESDIAIGDANWGS